MNPSPPGFPARVAVDPACPLGTIDPAIYGQFIEHVDAADECIYPSIWDAASPLADELGLRRDVISAARELGVPVVRWPGGSYADVYHWENAIGPRAGRRPEPNGHFAGDESNQFGTDEFLHWCERVGAQPYLNVNLGSGTLEEALRWLEYCNGSPDTPQGRRRAANGRVAPYGVKYWGVGNETWAPWEKGNMTAPAYAAKLREWAVAMRAADPSIRILGVGSLQADTPEWDRTVLREAGDVIDYLTFHTYGYALDDGPGDEAEFRGIVHTTEFMERRLRRTLALIDEVAPARAKDIRVSVDEWNIRRYTRAGEIRRRAPRTLRDTLFLAGLLNIFVRLSPRVGMGNYVFLVNGHAPILVRPEGILKTPVFDLFQAYSRLMRGEALEARVECPFIVPPAPQVSDPAFALPADHGHDAPSPLLHVAAARPSAGVVTLALVNRDPARAADVNLVMTDGGGAVSAWTLHDADARAANTFDTPDRLRPRVETLARPTAFWRCPPQSITLLTCRRA